MRQCVWRICGREGRIDEARDRCSRRVSPTRGAPRTCTSPRPRSYRSKDECWRFMKMRWRRSRKTNELL